MACKIIFQNNKFMQCICSQKSSWLIIAFIPICIIAQSQITNNSNRISVYSITSYGAVPDSNTSNTISIQKAVDDCHKHGGGTIVIPPGNFITGTVRLYSNMNISFEPGAILTG